MLLDEVVQYEPRRETFPPAAQVVVQEARIPIPGPSTAHSPRTLKKPNSTRARARYTHYYYPTSSTATSFAHPTAAVGLTRMASAESHAPVQPSSPSSSNRKLLKSRQGNSVPLINPALPSPSSPVSQAPRPTAPSSPVSQYIPPPIPHVQTSLSGLPDERVRGATRIISPEQRTPGSTFTRPLLSPLRPEDTPTVESSSEPRKIGVEPPLVPRYSKVRNKRWALWALYLLFGLGNLILAARMRKCFPKWNMPENNMVSPRADLSPPPRGIVDLWKVAPLVNVLVTCGLLAIFWVVDKWYPVTFISRPLPELLFYLILFSIQVATTVDQALYAEPTIQLLVDEYRLSPPDRDELTVEARASSVFMSIQAVIVLLAFGVVVYHVVHHMRHDGPKTPDLNVLKHPTCRYIAHAPPASVYFAPPSDTTRFKNEVSSTSSPV